MRFFTLFFTILLGLFLLALFFIPFSQLLSRYASAYLAEQGFPGSAIVISDWKPGKMVIERIELGGEQPVALGPLAIHYSHTGLITGNIEAITFAQTSLQLLESDIPRVIINGKLALKAKQLEGRLDYHDVHEILKGSVTLLYPLDETEGVITATLDETIFSSGIKQPYDLYPPLVKHLKKTEGSIAATMQAIVKNHEIQQTELRVILSNLSLTLADDMAIYGIEGEITLNNLTTIPTTDGLQQIDIKSIEAPLPLERGNLAFNLKEDQILIEHMRWHLGNGALSAKHVSLDRHTLNDIALTLEAEAIALTDILSFDPQELTSNATLSGDIPVTIKGKDITIGQGYLVTDQPGIIRYNPKHIPQNTHHHVALVQDILKDYEYESLQLHLNSDKKKRLHMQLNALGHNKQVYDGRAIKLNINISGNLIDLVQSSANLYALPEQLLK